MLALMRVVATEIIRNGHKLDIFWGEIRQQNLLKHQIQNLRERQYVRILRNIMFRSENLSGNRSGGGTRDKIRSLVMNISR